MFHGYFSAPKVEKRKCIQSPLTYLVTYFPITEIKKCLMGTHYRRRNLSWLPVSEEQSVIMGKAWQSIFRGSQSLGRQLIRSGGLAN